MKATAPAANTSAAQPSFFPKPGEGFFDTKGNTLFRKPGESFFGTKKSTVPVQAKLSVNAPGDAFEKEADAVADKVMRMPQPVGKTSVTPAPQEQLQQKEEQREEDRMQIGEIDSAPLMRVHDDEDDRMQTGEIDHAPLMRKPAGMMDEEDKMRIGDTDTAPLQRKEEEEMLQAKGEGTPDVTPSFEQSLQSSKGGGSPLPDGVKNHMETGIGADFSDVRVHTGSQAAQLSSSIQAQAFTHGSDIYFNEGKYSPGTDSGKHLLAHELTHTVQQGAAGVQRQIQRTPDPNVLVNGKPITIWLDADGDVQSKELKMVLEVQDTVLVITFSHKAGKKTYTTRIKPSNLNLTKGVWAEQAASTDGIRPLLVPLLGYKASDKTGKIGDNYYLGIIPGDKPGKYGFAGGSEIAADAMPKSIQYFDLGVPETYADEKRHKTLEEDVSPQKLGGLYKLSFIAGPQYNLSAELNIVPYPDDSTHALCYFETKVLGEKRGIQQSPGSGSKIAIPVPFDALQIEKVADNNGYISYRFSPQSQSGFVVTYQMSPEKQSKPDVNNAAHGFGIYKLGTDNSPLGITPEVGQTFTRAGNEWQYGYTKRTTGNFKVESGKDAFDKMSKAKLPDNETQSLLNEMAQIVSLAVKNNITSQAVYDEWMEMSLSVIANAAGTAKKDEQALKVQMISFMDHLTKEIGKTGDETSSYATEASSTTTTSNKYTGASETSTAAAFYSDTSKTRDFDKPRSLVQKGSYTQALKELRTSYWLFVSDKLIHNNNGNKAQQDQLKAYGYRMEYDNNLREQLQKEKGTLKKINAFYYPDQGNLTDDGGDVKFVGSSMAAVPLDMYYKLDGNEWVLYNYTTLAEPGKLNEFERRRTRKAGEDVPPKEIFDELTYDKGVGLGYIHYQTDKGTGGVVRVDHPWTIGEVLMTIGAIIGILALALTGVGLVVEGVAASAVVVGDIAAITVATGAVIKLGESYMHGEPVSAGMVASASLDVAIALMPALRLARGAGTLVKATEELVILKQLDAVLDARLLKQFNIAANATAIVVTSVEGGKELMALSKAVDEGLVDSSTFYWAVAKYIGMGAINVVMLHNDIKSLGSGSKENRLPKEDVGNNKHENKPTEEEKRNTEEKVVEAPRKTVTSLSKRLEDPKFATLKEKYDALSPELKSEFDADFTHATDDALLKMQNEGLIDVWTKDLRSNNMDVLATFKGKAGLRDEYIATIGELKPKAEKLLAEGMSKEEVARIVFEDRRRITIEFKHATPDDMLELILEFNTKRYKETGFGDEWGLSWEGVVRKATKDGVVDYDKIIKGAATPLGSKADLGKALLKDLGDKAVPVLAKYRML